MESRLHRFLALSISSNQVFNQKQDKIISATHRIETKVDSLRGSKGVVVQGDFQEEHEFDRLEDVKSDKHEEIVMPKKDILFLDRIKTRCKSEATKLEYVRINRDFNSWFHRNYHNKDTVE